MAYRFGPFWLDLDNATLWKGETRITLRPKTFDILVHLVSHAGELVTKDELLEAVWSDTAVSDSALTASMSELRRALGETAREARYIATVYRRGYRFIASVVMPDSESPPLETETAQLGQPSSTPLIIERTRELTALHDQFNAVRMGDRQLAFIVGEAGIGKTTLVDVFVSQTASVTPIWLGHGQCIDHYGTGEAYLPLLDAFGHLSRGPCSERCLAVLRQHAPSWLLQMPSLLSPTESEALEQRSRGMTQASMLRELTEAVEVLSQEQPLVLVLEDLHWSDHATLDWLSFVARQRTPAQLFILGTYRPADAIVRQHPIASVVHELQRQAKSAVLFLDYLSENGTKAYLSERLSGSTAHDDLVRVLYQRTNGNPFFLVTMVEEWIRQGILRDPSSGWSPEGVPTAIPEDIPNSVRHLIEQQLSILTLEELQLLERASVAGAQFSAAALAWADELTAEAVDNQLDNLARQGHLIQALGITSWPQGIVSGSYGFIHALYQEVLYNQISISRRMRLHQQIGLQLEAGYGEQAVERAAELALHFEQGGDAQRAISYLRHAGARAVSRSAQREAVQWYERALQRLEQQPQTPETTGQVIDLHLALRAALIPLAENEKSFDHLRAASRLAMSSGDTQRQGYIDAYLTRAWFSMSDYEQALETGHRALSNAQDDTQELSTKLYLSYAYRGVGAYQEAVELLEPLVAGLSSDPESDRLGLATLPAVSVRFSLTCVLAELGRFAEGTAYGEEAITIAEAHGHVFGIYQAYRGLGSVKLQQGHLDHAIPLLEQNLDRCQQAEMRGSLAVIASRLGLAYVYTGRLEEGLHLLEQGVARKVTSHHDYVLRLVLLASGYGYTGRQDEAFELAKEALELARGRREQGTEAYAQHLLGQLAAQSLESELNQAEEWYRQALGLAHKLGMRPLQAHCHRDLGHLYSRVEQTEPAYTELSKAAEMYRDMEMVHWLPQTRAVMAAIEK